MQELIRVKDIQQLIKSKIKLLSMNTTTTKEELEIDKLLRELKERTDKIKPSLLLDPYNKENIKTTNLLDNEYEYLTKEYKKAIEKKYSFKSKTDWNIDNYIEAHKENTLSEIKSLYQSKTKQQDKDIELLSFIASSGQKELRNISTELERQNSKLENLGLEIDKTENMMMRIRNKFERFSQNHSICKLYVIVILESIFLFYLLLV